MVSTPVFLHALTPLHSGTGQGVDVIDQPIARERATQLPIVPGSSIKGVLRDYYTDKGCAEVKTLFGVQASAEEDFAGALQFSDARLLLLPVRSLAGTFVWATSPFVLRRLERDLRAVSINSPEIPVVEETSWRAAANTCTLSLGQKLSLVAEDLSAAVIPDDPETKVWAEWIAARLFSDEDTAWQRELVSRFVILDDASFTYLAEYATEVAAHISIDDQTGTVSQHLLWYQESLPAESVLTALVRAEKPRNRDSKLKTAEDVLAEVYNSAVVQFGGKSTTGNGLARFVRFETGSGSK